MYSYKGKWALITGASAGIGEEFARELASRQVNLILVARRKERLASMVKTLSEQYSIKVEMISMDLADIHAPKKLFDEVQKLNQPIHILINNAGVGVYGKLDKTPIEKNQSMLLLNVVSLSLITQLFLPMLLKNKDGMIINVASTAAFQPLPYMSNYGASKAFVLSFTEALWAEYHKEGLRVIAMCPGPTDTEFFSAMGSKVPNMGKLISVKEIVKDTLEAAEQNRKTYIITGSIKNYILANAPRFITRKLSASLTERVLKSR